MRQILMAVALSCASVGLVSCESIPNSPAEVSNRSKVDEQAANTIELGYKLFRTGAEFAVDAGLVKTPAQADSLARIDNAIFRGTQAVQAAKTAGDAPSFWSAYDGVVATLASGNSALAILKGK